MKRKHMLQKCTSCLNKIIPNWKQSHGWANRKFCSYRCYWKTLRGKPLSEKTKKRISIFRKAHPVSSIFKKGNRAPKTAFKKGFTPWNKGIEWIENRGPNHPRWKGGISEKIRKYNRPKSKKWGKQIFQRDNWTCVYCKNKLRNLHAHHIKSWVKYPQLRFDLENGVTLCVECHKKIHYDPVHYKKFQRWCKRRK